MRLSRSGVFDYRSAQSERHRYREKENMSYNNDNNNNSCDEVKPSDFMTHESKYSHAAFCEANQVLH